MRYFVVNLLAHCLVAFLLIVFTVVLINRNRKNKTKHGILYLAPFFGALIAVLDLFFFTAPRLLDIQDMVNNTSNTEIGVIQEIGFLDNYLIIDGHTYYINPLAQIPDEGSNVRIRYTSYANYIVEMQLQGDESPEDLV